MMNLLRHPLVRFFSVPIAGAVVWYGSEYLHQHNPDAAQPQQPIITWPTPKFATPAVETTKQITPKSQLVNRDYVIAAGRVYKSGNIYLDSIEGESIAAPPGSIPNVKGVVGQTIHVRGHTTMYRGKPRVLASSVTPVQEKP